MPWGDIVFMMILAGINLVRVAVDGVGGQDDTSSTARPEQGLHLPCGARTGNPWNQTLNSQLSTLHPHPQHLVRVTVDGVGGEGDEREVCCHHLL